MGASSSVYGAPVEGKFMIRESGLSPFCLLLRVVPAGKRRRPRRWRGAPLRLPPIRPAIPF